MEIAELYGFLDGASDDPKTMLMTAFGYLMVRLWMGQGKAESTVEEHKDKAEDIKGYARVIMRSLDVVVKAIDMHGTSPLKTAITELSSTDPEVREMIIKAVDRRKIEEHIERKALSESDELA